MKDCVNKEKFSNKIWNASDLLRWEVEDIPQAKSAQVAISWFQQKLNKAIAELMPPMLNTVFLRPVLTISWFGTSARGI